MANFVVDCIQKRIDSAKEDSDFTYFYALLLQGEALFKATVLGIISCVISDPDRHRYRLEYRILHSDSLGPWSEALDDALTGPASQFLIDDLSKDKNELTKSFGKGTWQFDAVSRLKDCLDLLGIETDEMPTQVDMRRWFRLFAVLRNKTRGHGATMPAKVSGAATSLMESISLIKENQALLKRDWAYLYRNLSGKYRVTKISGSGNSFDELKRIASKSYPNGVYLYAGSPRQVQFLESDADLSEFYFPNGNFTKKTFELLSYATDNRRLGDGASHGSPPGSLPPSETQGLSSLGILGKSFTNAPDLQSSYIARPTLEAEIVKLVEDDRHPVITLLGRGGIGKTSLALKVLDTVSQTDRFPLIIWFSARDVDLQFTGPKPTTPHIQSPEDVAQLYVSLLEPKQMDEAGFRAKSFFENQLKICDLGPCLYVFDNFETVQDYLALYSWLDTHIRLPNKILITTRLRDFKGDFPVEVAGMTEVETRELITATAKQLGIVNLLSESYILDLIKQAEGHPYVTKILLGEVARERRAGPIQKLLAGRDEILTALLERTYATLTPCGQRAFLTMAVWNSAVPRIALEAILHISIGEREEIEKSIDHLIQYSLAERRNSVEDIEFIQLPLVALLFGRQKLKISPFHASIERDAKVLQMLGPVNKSESHISMQDRIHHFMTRIAKEMERGESLDKYYPIVEMISRQYPPAWLALARLYMEESSYGNAKSALRNFLQHDSTSNLASEAWRRLAQCCFKTGDLLGDLHAFVQRSKIATIPFDDLTSTARLLNDVLRKKILEAGPDEKRALGEELLQVMVNRKAEAKAYDLTQMAWLALRLKDFDLASDLVKRGLELDSTNIHLINLSKEPNISL